MEWVILKALTKERDERYQDVTTMLKALRTAEEANADWDPRPPKRPSRMRGILRPLALSVGAVLVLLAVFAGLLWLGPRLGPLVGPSETMPAVALVVNTATPVSLPVTPTSTLTPVVSPSATPVLSMAEGLGTGPVEPPTSLPTALPTPISSPTPSPSPTPTLSPTPTPSPTPSPTPYLTVGDDHLNVYARPGERYEVLGEVRRGDRLPILGRSEDEEWWQVDYLGWRGWIAAQSVAASVELQTSSVVEAPPVPTTELTETFQHQCEFVPAGDFELVWRQVGVGERLGCPANQVHNIGSTSELFQNGFMYGREDIRRIYVVYSDGHWQEFVETWSPDQPERAGCTPPPGLVEPRMGFGKVWREELGDTAALDFETHANRHTDRSISLDRP